MNGLFGLQSSFSCICDITKITPPTEIRMVGGWGERLVEHRTFQNQNPLWDGCFYITVFLKETNCFQKMLDVMFISSCI